MKTALIEASFRQSSQIASAAENLTARFGRYYAKDEAPLSPYPALTGNRIPGKTRLWWLKGLYKCNQFIGDVLTLAGFRMPIFRMADGSEHYVNAEALLQRSAEFSRLTCLQDLRPGDILLIDWREEGENGAHLEIIADINLTLQRLLTFGAHKSGASLSDYSWLFRGASSDAQRSCWINHSLTRGRYDIYALRPLVQQPQA